MNTENTYVYIGRFQIPHLGHEAVIEHAIKNADKLVILIGSANLPRDTKNPFTYEERKEMIEAITQRIQQEHNKFITVHILPVDDFNSNEMWTQEVKSIVQSVSKSNITITGCKKSGDESTFYLNLFPEWKQDFIQEVNISGFEVVSSTKIRELFFAEKAIPAVISSETLNFLENFQKNNLTVFKTFQI